MVESPCYIVASFLISISQPVNIIRTCCLVSVIRRLRYGLQSLMAIPFGYNILIVAEKESESLQRSEIPIRQTSIHNLM